MDVQRTLEHDLELLCLTGVEDKLQVFIAFQERIMWPITHFFTYCFALCHVTFLVGIFPSTALTALKNILWPWLNNLRALLATNEMFSAMLYLIIMFIGHSYLFVACFNFQVDVRPTLEMLRNAGIKVTRLLLTHGAVFCFILVLVLTFIQSVYFSVILITSQSVYVWNARAELLFCSLVAFSLSLPFTFKLSYLIMKPNDNYVIWLLADF